MSFRNYWSIGELLQDWQYWRNAYPKYNQEKAHASWRVLLMKWSVPAHVSIDELAQDQIEGRNIDFGVPRPIPFVRSTQRRM